MLRSFNIRSPYLTTYRGLSNRGIDQFNTGYLSGNYGHELWMAASQQTAQSYLGYFRLVEITRNSILDYKALLLKFKIPRSLVSSQSQDAMTIDVRRLPGQDVSPIIEAIGLVRIKNQTLKNLLNSLPDFEDKKKLQQLAEKVFRSKYTENPQFYRDLDFNLQIDYTNLIDQTFHNLIIEQIEKRNPEYIIWIQI